MNYDAMHYLVFSGYISFVKIDKIFIISFP